MKVTQSWKRNQPSTVSGYSLTVTVTYSSFNEEEINEIEKMLPGGTVIVNAETRGCEENGEGINV